MSYRTSLLLFSPVFCYFSPVISRSYCFLTIEIICVGAFYKKRNKNPILWGLLLSLMLQTHIYLVGLSAMLLLQMLYEFIIEKDKKKKQKIFIGGIIGAISIILLWFELTGNSPYRDDCFSKMKMNVFISIGKSIMQFVKCIMFNFSVIGNGIFCTLAFVNILIFWVIKNKIFKQEFFIFIISIIFIFFIYCVRPSGHWNHSVSVFTVCLLPFFIFPEKPKKFVYVIFVFLMLCSCFTSFKFIFEDIYEPFSNSKSMAKYIENNFNNETLFILNEDSIAASSLRAYLNKDIKIVYKSNKNEFLYWQSEHKEVNNNKYEENNFKNIVYIFFGELPIENELELIYAENIVGRDCYYLYKKKK